MEQIPRDENGEDDDLDKMISLLTEINDWEIPSHTELASTIDSGPPAPLEETWMNPLFGYILSNQLPEDLDWARKIKRQDSQFTIIEGACTCALNKSQCWNV